MEKENENYSWGPDDKFEISGRTLGLFLNTFRAILRTEQALPILLASKSDAVMDEIIAEYVEKGVIKKVVKQTEQSNGNN